MPLICYREKRFSAEQQTMIRRANAFIRDLRRGGFSTPTVRQVYYNAISSNWIPDSWIDPVYNQRQGLAADTKNTTKNYKRLADLINDARLAGLIDWEAIEDRLRTIERNSHWTSPTDILDSCRAAYRIDHWEGQPWYCECYVEKDALLGVVAQPCRELDITYFACRGYTSQSAMWEAARRLAVQLQAGRKVYVIHLGDHDPSGIDMTRDIEDRLRMFLEGDGVAHEDTFEFERIALNWDQIEEHSPPPNPAKLSDSRAPGYIERFGDDSWELDALHPSVIAQLIRDKIQPRIDQDILEEVLERERTDREEIRLVAANWEAARDAATEAEDELEEPDEE